MFLNRLRVYAWVVQHQFFESGIPKVHNRYEKWVTRETGAEFVGLLLRKGRGKDTVTETRSNMERRAKR